MTYDTDIHALMAAGNAAPIADAELGVRAGRAPLEVSVRRLAVARPGRLDREPTSWDFGDGSSASGPESTHTYTSGGRYFPTLTVTDNGGASTVFVDEIVVDLPAAPTVRSGGASGTTVHGAVGPENQPTTWSVEYGPTSEYGAVATGGRCRVTPTCTR